MIDCLKKYKMVLSSTDGEIIYKSDNVQVEQASAWDHEINGRMTVEIKMTAWGMGVETAETPPEMPLAGVAAQATKIIREEKRKVEVEKQWKYLTEIVCHAIKRGDEYAVVKDIFDENKLRLIEMGYEVDKNRVGDWEIRWVEPYLR
jgi:hypothetical protein